jgi:hypothetical protein
VANSSASKDQKVENPASSFDRPGGIIKDKALSGEEKKKALNTWEQDARQLLTASNEGMPASDEGLTREDTHKLGQVVRAKLHLGGRPKEKPSQ